MDVFAGHSVSKYRSSVLIAPYSPVGRGEMVHLGASRKIEFVLQLLSTISEQVTLVNSAHNGRRWSSSRTVPLTLSPTAKIVEHIPFETPIRPIGKLLNLLFSRATTRFLRRLNPDLVWLYNGYAFECFFTLKILKTLRPTVVIEIEDDHAARSRGLWPKPWLDRQLLTRTLPHSHLITIINSSMAGRYSKHGAAELIFPGAVTTELLEGVRRAPFSLGQTATAGYFGALDKEKGADVILDVISQYELPNWRFIICGSGPLLSKFKDAAERFNGRLSVHHDVAPQRLYQLMNRTDVIINPHTSIVAMRDGVFPFKVLEAVATGRLLLSTKLPPCRPDISQAVYQFDGTSADLAHKLMSARAEARERQRQIDVTSAHVRQIYSLEGVRAQVLKALRGVE